MTKIKLEETREKPASAARRGDDSRELQIWSDYPSGLRIFTHDSLLWNTFTNNLSPDARRLFEARFPGAAPRPATG